MTRRFFTEPWSLDRLAVVDDHQSGAITVRVFAPWIDGPDCKALAEAEADRLEAAHGPEWVVGDRSFYVMPCVESRRTGARLVGYDGWSWDDMAALCRLLNEHPLPEDGAK